MKFSHRLRVIFFTYIWVILGLFSIVYFNLFDSQKTFFESIIYSFITIPSGVQVLDIKWQMLYVVFVSLLPHLFFQTFKIRRAVTLVVILSLTILIGPLFVLNFYKLKLPIFYAEIALFVGTVVAVILKMIFSSTEQEFLRTAFSQFVSEDMLKELLRNPDKLKLQGKEMVITVMFLDIRGFTTFSEKNSPQLVVNRLNELLEIVSRTIIKHHGHVNKFIGDSVMAFWGAPNLDKKQAQNACRAAIEIRHKIETETEFKVGIGINYGRTIVGNIGSKQRFDYTVIGDTVNTAARLESATKELNETIIISESVVNKLTDERIKFELNDLGNITVKGKSAEVHVYGLLG